MSSPLRFRVGTKFGIAFQARLPSNAQLVRKGTGAEGLLTDWAAVGVRSILKDHWQDGQGRWQDSVYFYELAPGDEDNRIAVDEFYVAGGFTIVRHETVPHRANDAWKAFVAR
ncbi:MAG: hypothetical protein ACOY0T_31060 [Myxococcota bacterium]